MVGVVKKYVPPNLNQDGLDTTVPVPVSQDGQSRVVNSSVDLAYERKVDTRDELNKRWFLGVFLATDNLQTVNSVLVDSLNTMHGTRNTKAG